MDVDLARMCFAATAAFVPFGLHRKSLSSTTAVALKVLITGTDLAVLNKGFPKATIKESKVDESAIFHLVTTVFILYAPRLKPTTRARMLKLLTFGDMLHALSRSDIFTPAPEALIPKDKAWAILGIATIHEQQQPFALTHAKEKYIALMERAKADLQTSTATQARIVLQGNIKTYERAFCSLFDIHLSRQDAIREYFTDKKGNPVIIWPENGQLSNAQKKTLYMNMHDNQVIGASSYMGRRIANACTQNPNFLRTWMKSRRLLYTWITTSLPESPTE